MLYELTGVTEHAITVKTPPASPSGKTVQVGWEFGLELIPSADELEVKLHAAVSETNRDNAEPLVELVVSHHFKVKGKDVVVDNVIAKSQRQFVATLLGISLGTVRGLAYARTVGVLGKRLIMPVVNPTEMLNGLYPE